MANYVAQHNVKTLKDNDQNIVQQPGCNCQGVTGQFPVQGKCLTDSVVYRATVTETVSGKVKTYTGVTSNSFKDRYNGHKYDIRHQKGRHNTCLTNHIWNLKDENKDYDIEWQLIDRAPAFNPTTRKCRVCLKEKRYILYNQTGSSLNKRHEIFSTCRHRTQKLLSNVKA